MTKAPAGPAEKLEKALTAVDWNGNVAVLLKKDKKQADAIASVNLRMALWSRQFETLDRGNPALCFVREMQMAGQHVAALIALSMYKPAAAGMRSMLETALYYTYFRTHGSELATLARDRRYYLDKRDILDFHKQHTERFNKLQEAVGLLSRLEEWYGFVSAIVHGQLPGRWITYSSLADIKHDPKLQPEVTSTFVKGGDIVHALFLCTVGQLFWSSFSAVAKRQLISGLSGDAKTALQLDSA